MSGRAKGKVQYCQHWEQWLDSNLFVTLPMAMALGVGLSTFFAAPEPSAARLVRADARPLLASTWSPVTIEALGPLEEASTLEPIMLTLAPGGRSGLFPAAPGGEKF